MSVAFINLLFSLILNVCFTVLKFVVVMLVLFYNSDDMLCEIFRN